jgi:hypothetical protein
MGRMLARASLVAALGVVASAPSAQARLTVYARWNVSIAGSVTHTWSEPDSEECKATGSGSVKARFGSVRPGKIKIADNGYGVGDFGWSGALTVRGTIIAIDNRTRNGPDPGHQPCGVDPQSPVPDKRSCGTGRYSRAKIFVSEDPFRRGHWNVEGGGAPADSIPSAGEDIPDCETGRYADFTQIYGGRSTADQMKLPIRYPTTAQLRSRKGSFSVTATQRRRFNTVSQTVRRVTLTFTRTG